MLSTALVIFFAWLIWNLIKARIARKLNNENASEIRRMRKLRSRFNFFRNIIVGIATFSIVAIWGSTIGGFAISVAALAGGLLVVSKEFIANLLGFAMFSLTRPFRIGDHIEIDEMPGRVSDIGIMSFEMMQFEGGHHSMGRIVSMPNAIMLTRPIHNLSITGEFVMRVIEVSVGDLAHALLAREALLHASKVVCAPWIDEAQGKLQQIAHREMMEFADANPQVLLDLRHRMEARLSLRFPCKGHEQIQVEQAILSAYLINISELQPIVGSQQQRLKIDMDA
jgi:hypothetical protein